MTRLSPSFTCTVAEVKLTISVRTILQCLDFGHSFHLHKLQGSVDVLDQEVSFDASLTSKFSKALLYMTLSTGVKKQKKKKKIG
jgi:hypothetical protein